MYHRFAVMILISVLLSSCLSSCAATDKKTQTVSSASAVNDDVPVKETDVIDKTTVITLTGEDQEQYGVTVESVFQLSGKLYALVYPQEKGKPPVVMRLVPQGEQSTFQVIDDDAEFNHVIEIVGKHPELMKP